MKSFGKWYRKVWQNPPAASNSPVSGKTGTAQISQGAAGYKSGRVNYLVSFCGYFPRKHPNTVASFSIQKPGLPASGGLMAGSVFGKIAERVYAKDLRFDIRSAIDSTTNVIPRESRRDERSTPFVLNDLKVPVQKQFAGQKKKEQWGHTQLLRRQSSCKTRNGLGTVPSVVGMGSERCGSPFREQRTEIRLNGVGRVRNQSIASGSRISERTNHSPGHYVNMRINKIWIYTI